MRTIASKLACVGVAIVLVGFAACTSPRTVQDTAIVPVPEEARRLAYAVTGSPPRMPEAALSQSVCLLLSGNVDECRTTPDLPELCNDRSPENLRATLRTVFDSLPTVRLLSESPAKRRVREIVPDAEPTVAVFDARRATHCNQWRDGDGPCLAVRVDSLWVLLTAAPNGDGNIDTVEVFLAVARDQVCANTPSTSG